MNKDFLEELKIKAPTLYQIHIFIEDTARLGFGVVEFEIKSHDYISKMIDMKAVKPKDKELPTSIGKKVIITKEKGGEDKK